MAEREQSVRRGSSLGRGRSDGATAATAAPSSARSPSHARVVAPASSTTRPACATSPSSPSAAPSLPPSPSPNPPRGPRHSNSVASSPLAPRPTSSATGPHQHRLPRPSTPTRPRTTTCVPFPLPLGASSLGRRASASHDAMSPEEGPPAGSKGCQERAEALDEHGGRAGAALYMRPSLRPKVVRPHPCRALDRQPAPALGPAQTRSHRTLRYPVERRTAS